MDKLSKRLDSDILRKIILKAKQHQYYVFGCAALLLGLFGYFMWFYQPLKPIWKPIGPNLLFALRYDTGLKDSAIIDQIEQLLGEDFSSKWEDFGKAVLKKEDVKPQESVVSWHTAYSESPQVLYNWRFNEKTSRDVLLAIQNQSSLKIRQYREEKIYQYSNAISDFHFYLINRVLTASTSPLLLEASLRVLTNDVENVQPKVVKQLKKDGIGLIINLNAIAEAFDALVGFPKHANSPVRLSALNLVANSKKIQAFYSENTFAVNDKSIRQTAFTKKSDLLYNTTQPLEKAQVSKETKQRLSLLKERFGFDVDNLRQGLSNTFTHFILRSEYVLQPYQVLAFPLKDSSMVSSELARLHPNVLPNAKVFTLIKQPALPNLILPMKLDAFPNIYYLIQDSVLWLSNFSLPQQKLKALKAASLSTKGIKVYINHALKFSFTDKLGTLGERFFDKIDGAALYFQRDSVFIDIDLQGDKSVFGRLDTLLAIPTKRQIKKQVFPVKNHYTNALEFLWQDEKTRLHLMSDSGEFLWEKAVWYFAKDHIHQVDIYNNEKLQYAFVSDGRIHAYDRLGRTLNGFPIGLSTYFEAQFLRPLRWKNEKEQRFLVAGSLPGNAKNSGGKLYLYNRYGGLSRGWAPRNVEAPLACAPKLISHEGKDVILALLKNGSFYAFDKNGRVMPGFPLITNLICSSAFLVDRARNIHFMSEGGTIIELDLQGRLLKREQVRSRITGTIFHLLPEQQSGADFLVAMQQGRRLVVKDRNLKAYFTHTLTSDNPQQLAYYDFGEDKKFLLVFDERDNTCRLLNEKGKDWLAKPLATQIMPLLIARNGSRIDLVLSKDNSITVLSNGE